MFTFSKQNLSVRAEGPVSSTAGDGDVWVSDEEVEEEMVAGGSDSNQKKKKKKKKKKKSGEKAGQQPPQEKKLDKPAQLDIFEVLNIPPYLPIFDNISIPPLQYAKQVPVRPVLNRKDTKTSTTKVCATIMHKVFQCSVSVVYVYRLHQPLRGICWTLLHPP